MIDSTKIALIKRQIAAAVDPKAEKEMTVEEFGMYVSGQLEKLATDPADVRVARAKALKDAEIIVDQAVKDEHDKIVFVPFVEAADVVDCPMCKSVMVKSEAGYTCKCGAVFTAKADKTPAQTDPPAPADGATETQTETEPGADEVNKGFGWETSDLNDPTVADRILKAE